MTEANDIKNLIDKAVFNRQKCRECIFACCYFDLFRVYLFRVQLFTNRKIYL